MDIEKAFHHIPVRPCDIPKTAIITPFGLFEYMKMPFGLRNAAQSIQRFISALLQDLPFVFVHVDDVLIASADEEEHERLKSKGLTVKKREVPAAPEERNIFGAHHFGCRNSTNCAEGGRDLRIPPP